MMPYKIREFLAQFTLSRFMQKTRKPRAVSITSPRTLSVLIALQDAGNSASVRSSLQILKQHFPQADIQFYTYNPKIKKEVVYSERNLNVLDPMDVNWYLKPLNMRPAHVDMLLDFTRKKNIPLLFFLLFGQAKCKAGVARSWNESILDLQFEVPEKFELTYVCEQFVHYFELLKQK
jgi:hypothetical protein